MIQKFPCNYPPDYHWQIKLKCANIAFVQLSGKCYFFSVWQNCNICLADCHVKFQSHLPSTQIFLAHMILRWAIQSGHGSPVVWVYFFFTFERIQISRWWKTVALREKIIWHTRKAKHMTRMRLYFTALSSREIKYKTSIHNLSSMDTRQCCTYIGKAEKSCFILQRISEQKCTTQSGAVRVPSWLFFDISNFISKSLYW